MSKRQAMIRRRKIRKEIHRMEKTPQNAKKIAALIVEHGLLKWQCKDSENANGSF
jgi:hypothetical protein